MLNKRSEAVEAAGIVKYLMAIFANIGYKTFVCCQYLRGLDFLGCTGSCKKLSIATSADESDCVISASVSSPVAIISSKDDHKDDFSGELSARRLLADTESLLSDSLMIETQEILQQEAVFLELQLLMMRTLDL